MLFHYNQLQKIFLIISRPRQSQGLLYKHRRKSFIMSYFSSHSFTALPCTVWDTASSREIDDVLQVQRILCFKEYTNNTTNSKFTAILLNGWILPIGRIRKGLHAACKECLFCIKIDCFSSFMSHFVCA